MGGEDAGANLARAMAAVRPGACQYELVVMRESRDGKVRRTSHATAEDENLERLVFCDTHIEGRCEGLE